MTVVVTEKANTQEVADTLENVAREYVTGAERGKVHGKQIEIILPKEHQENFSELFEHLEDSMEILKISGFGLSLNTLEQVFLKVAEITDPTSFTFFAERRNNLVQAQKVDRRKGCPLRKRQIWALITKRILYCVRNWSQLISQLLIPLAIMLAITFMVDMSVKRNVDQERLLSFYTFGQSRILVKIVNTSTIADEYLSLISNTPGAEVHNLNASTNLTDFIEHLPKQLPAAGLGAVFYENGTELLFNSRAYHSLPCALNLFANARLRAETRAAEGMIRTSLFAYTPPPGSGISQLARMLEEFLTDTMLGLSLVFSLALFTSTLVIFLVEERVSKFAHQQFLTGISPIVFWTTSFLYDFIFYSNLCACILMIFIFNKWMQDYLVFIVLLFVLYFWSCVPFVYAVSFMFSSPTKASILLILWQLIAAFIALLVAEIVEFLATEPWQEELLRSVLLCLLPSYAFGLGVLITGVSSTQRHPPHMLWRWNGHGRIYSFMLVFGCFASLLFIVFQFKIVRLYWHKISQLRYCLRDYTLAKHDDEDAAVAEERLYLQSAEVQMALEVKDLYKMYGHFKALDGLTMGVRVRECFGLLGENGAGKTTTFDIITGQSYATSGTVRVDGRDVTEQIPIGYCPQFDALMPDLTGRETLRIFALLHGFPQPNEMADFIINSVGMANHADKKIRYCSGGQRRKISVGVALLAPTRIIILDEPTAGIDPMGRREIWNVLSIIRDNTKSSLLLTSHSMDECEALCSRIAILRKGRLIALGTSQQLKLRYGKSYTISMVVPHMDSRDAVIDGVQQAFPKAVLKSPKQSLALSLKWQIPKTKNDRWSTLYRDVQKLAQSLGVVDYCVTQTSLEDVFLKLSQDHKEDGSHQRRDSPRDKIQTPSQ